MATQNVVSSSLVLVYNNGFDTNGKPITKAKSYRNVKPTATPDQLVSAAQAISGLQSKIVEAIDRRDSLEVLA
ncbi:MAG: hypothetical protein K0S51_1276 [Bacillales bacterium]|jgi:hypothetical protein|nr:hypothetical protein [Bacillales bacterium]